MESTTFSAIPRQQDTRANVVSPSRHPPFPSGSRSVHASPKLVTFWPPLVTRSVGSLVTLPVIVTVASLIPAPWLLVRRPRRSADFDDAPCEESARRSDGDLGTTHET